MHMSRVSGLTLGLMVAGVMAIAGCGSGGADNESAAGTGAAASASSSDFIKQLTVGATDQSSSAYPFYVAFANMVNKNVHGATATVQATGASVDNVRKLGDDSIQLGLVTEDTAYQAYHGQGAFQGKAEDNLRTLFVYESAPQFYLVRQNSGVSALTDLTGKKWSPGFSGSATETITKLLFGQLGIKPSYFGGSLDDITTAVRNGSVLGLAKGGSMHSLDQSVLEIATQIPLQAVPFTASQVGTIRQKDPYISFAHVPSSTYSVHNVTGPAGGLQTWQVVTSVGSTSSLPQAEGYAIAKAAIDHKGDLESAYPNTKAYDYVKDTLRYSTIPLQAGMVQYLEEQGVNVPKRLIPPEYKPASR